jgi:ATP-binding protein involved in chromosome partitioning
MGSGDGLREGVTEALRTVLDPELRVDLVTAKMVKEVEIRGRDARVVVELTTPACPLRAKIEDDVRAALRRVNGLGEVVLEFTARVRAASTVADRAPLPGIQNIIAVAAGKGGVGKSTVAVNVALALAQDGARVGLMDADVYGPSIPKMLGLPTAQPEARGGRIVPCVVAPTGQPLKVMSMAFFLQDDQPVIWRGPMLHKVIQQFLQEVEWGELDYLVVDLPPGTGDVQLSLSQSVPLSGTLIVTTPQDVALLDVRKAAAMFEKVLVPILGIIENMAGFECPCCHAVTPVFGAGGGERYATERGYPFLGSVPLDAAVCAGGDAGQPAVARQQDSAAARALREAARRLAGQLSVRARAGGQGFAVELPVL